MLLPTATNNNKTNIIVMSSAEIAANTHVLPVYLHKKVKGYTVVDEDIYTRFKTVRLHDCCGYVRTGTTCLHHLIMPRKPGYVIDHKDNNPYNNTRENLRYATFEQNAQNSIGKGSSKPGEVKSSKYLGVSWDSHRRRWHSRYGATYIGRFPENKEIHAAYAYDLYVTLKLGVEGTKINGVNVPDDWDENFVFPENRPKKQREFGNGVYEYRRFFDANGRENVLYEARYSFGGKNIRIETCFSTPEEADAVATEARRILAQNEFEKHVDAEIPINAEGHAYISVIDSEDIRHEIIVDDFRYIYLNRYKWHINAYGYATTTKDSKHISMHRYIMQAVGVEGLDDSTKVVDHINGNRLDNRLENLRLVSHAVNAHNRKLDKTTTQSQYIGVLPTKAGDKWTSRVSKDGVVYNCGTFNDPIKAAIAYNNKAIELYGEHANINMGLPTTLSAIRQQETVISDDEDICNNSGDSDGVDDCDNDRSDNSNEDGENDSDNEPPSTVAPKKKSKNLQSQYTGVRTGKNIWWAEVSSSVDGKRKMLRYGPYDSEIDAALAYNQLKKKVINKGLPNRTVELYRVYQREQKK